MLGLLACGHCQAAAETLPADNATESSPVPTLTPEEALLSFSIAPGFGIELVAGEPLIEDPVAITWDEFGNLYAAEMRGFMPDTYGTNQTAPVGAVVRLKDRDGDGVYDQREVLADELVLPRAVAIVNEGLLIGEPPHLWLCPNRDGSAATISCASKVSLGSYGDQPGSVEHAENGLLMGLDNWLYSAKSTRRLRIVDGELDSEPTLFRGQWGITKDSQGRLYFNTNSVLLLGDSYDAQAVVRAGSGSAPGLGARISQRDQMFAVRANRGVNRAYVPGVLREDGRLNQPTSASGMAVYRGDQFGLEYSDDVFVAEPAANVVAQLRLKRDGLLVTAEQIFYADEQWQQREFLASTDERFRPVDVKVGPDGALYVVDMYRGVIQDHVFISEELRAHAKQKGLDRPLGMGRIWRIARQGGGLGPNGFDGLPSGEARLALLGHPNGWMRDTAQRLLIAENSPGTHDQLVELVRSAQPLGAVHALWTLSGRAELEGELVLEALEHEDSKVRLAALEAGGGLLSAEALLNLSRERRDPAFFQQIILSLAAHNGLASVQARLIDVLESLRHDAYTRAAVQAAAFGEEMSILRGLLATGIWDAQTETSTGFVSNLVSQGLRSGGGRARAWLDMAAATLDQDWLARALLHGFFQLTRDEDFERLVLTEAHEIFSSEKSELWPVISRARRAVTWQGDDLALGAKPLTPVQSQNRKLGAQYYRARCATCHGTDGAGLASLGPPLAGTTWVQGPSEILARVLLQGLGGPIEVNGETWDSVMPGHALMPDFDDATAAGLLTYLNRAWGHEGRAIEPAFVARTREETRDRIAPWTVEELLKVRVNTHYEQYEGRYGGTEFPLEFVYTGRELEVRSGIFNGPLLEEREDHFVFEPRQMRLEFVLADDGKVTGVRMATPEGGMLIPRVGDL